MARCPGCDNQLPALCPDCQKNMEQGAADVEAGRLTDHEDVKIEAPKSEVECLCCDKPPSYILEVHDFATHGIIKIVPLCSDCWEAMDGGYFP